MQMELELQSKHHEKYDFIFYKKWSGLHVAWHVKLSLVYAFSDELLLDNGHLFVVHTFAVGLRYPLGSQCFVRSKIINKEGGKCLIKTHLEFFSVKSPTLEIPGKLS